MADAGVATASGAKLYIGTTAALAATDTFVEVAQIATLPEFGREYDLITFKPVSSRAAKKLKGNYNDGDVTISLGKDLTNAGQLALQVARDVDADYNFKIVDNDDVPVASTVVTITIAAPGVVAWAVHGLPAGTAVVLTTTGTLPTGLVAGTTYYIASGATLLAGSFALSSTLANALAGTVITTTSTQSGVHTATSAPVGTYVTFKAQVTSFKTLRGDGSDIIKASAMLAIQSGTMVETIHLP